MVKQYRGQSYSKLHTEATRTQQLFTDPLFPPTGESLGHETNQEVVWKRPSVRTPHLHCVTRTVCPTISVCSLAISSNEGERNVQNLLSKGTDMLVPQYIVAAHAFLQIGVEIATVVKYDPVVL